MADWTKGPWTVDGPPDNQIVWSGPGERVCFLAHSDGKDEERDVATGRLITSAPDLAEAAEEAMLRLPRVMGNLVGADLEDVQTTYAALRAALKKAKGEA